MLVLSNSVALAQVITMSITMKFGTQTAQASLDLIISFLLIYCKETFSLAKIAPCHVVVQIMYPQRERSYSLLETMKCWVC
jgi:hypothetical protein